MISSMVKPQVNLILAAKKITLKMKTWIIKMINDPTNIVVPRRSFCCNFTLKSNLQIVFRSGVSHCFILLLFAVSTRSTSFNLLFFLEFLASASLSDRIYNARSMLLFYIISPVLFMLFIFAECFNCFHVKWIVSEQPKISVDVLQQLQQQRTTDRKKSKRKKLRLNLCTVTQ